MLIDGSWSTEWYGADAKGHFVRERTRFHDRVTRDGSTGFAPERDRYHLYVSYACPWAHRTLIVRALRKLEDVISVSVVDPFMGRDGWAFTGADGSTEDAVGGAKFLRDVYLRANARYTGRVTVPVLWDKKKGTIVNNESKEIVRMLDDAFRDLGDPSVHFNPPELTGAIDATIEAIYQPINNGVYRAGFASTQGAYDEAVTELFDALERWDAHLGTHRYLCGDVLTEVDFFLFTTLVRLEPVYHTHFKCNVKRLRDFPNLWNHTKEIYQLPGVAKTTRFDHIKEHYFRSHEGINPSRIVPKGPEIDFHEPHDRERLPARRMG